MLTSLKVNTLADKKRKAQEDDPRRYAGGPLLGNAPYTPLPHLLEAFELLIKARGDKDWKSVGIWSIKVCDHWANLPEAERDALEEAFPGAPEFLGWWSGLAWVAYLAALIAVPERRERLGGALRAAVARGGGGRLSPSERDSVCGDLVKEVSF
jgi:hypothetical protein